MSASTFVPYGVKSLVECLTRATLLAQPDDIPEFLSTHVAQMVKLREEQPGDVKDVIFNFQEQWEKDFLRKQILKEFFKTAQEKSPSPTCSVSSSPSLPFTASPPHEVRHGTRTVSSNKIPSRQERVGRAAKETSASTKPRSVPPTPHGKKAKTLRTPCRNEAKPSLPSAWPVLPPIPQKGAKQVQQKKSTKGHVSGVYTCRLTDCPYHAKPEERSDRDPGREKPLASPGTFELQVPYRPKGGPVVDPELVPRRTRAGPATDKTTGVEGTLLYSSCGVAYAVSETTNSTDLTQVSLESFSQTCPCVAHCVHIVQYRHMYQCGKLPPSIKSTGISHE